jgi:hypothetical protein
MSICLTPLGHWAGHVPQVVHRQMSSPSTSLNPKAASRINRRIEKSRTLFHGHTESHNPHWKHILNISPPASFISSITSMKGAKVSTVLYSSSFCPY